MKRFIQNTLKGFGMGAANVVPGVSGGTVALITGIYADIVNALNALTKKQSYSALFHLKIKDFCKEINAKFLLALALGVVISIFSLAKVVKLSLEQYPIFTWAFFFGLVLASAIVMFKAIQDWKMRDAFFALLGIALGVFICTLSPSDSVADSHSLLSVFICGAVSICAMILPGLSGSFIMILFGKYDYIMTAITKLNWSVLLVFALGCIIGLLAFAKLLHWLLARFERQTMIVLLGFVVGSLIKIWPWQNPSTGFPMMPNAQIIGAVISCIIGALLVIGIDLIASKKQK